jgi:hypothetical protein
MVIFTLDRRRPPFERDMAEGQARTAQSGDIVERAQPLHHRWRDDADMGHDLSSYAGIPDRHEAKAAPIS